MYNRKDKFLVAYYTTAEQEIESSTLRKFLAATLPVYMVPAYFVPLTNMPVTVNGKLDRNALPAHAIKAKNDYRAPSNETEGRVVGLWSDILQLDTSVISIHQSFFELGGHSLKATVLVNKIMKEFDVEIPLQDVFSMDTVERLADYIDNEKWLKEKNPEPITLREEFIIE